MKFGVVGAGAIGGLVGARLALAGHEVTLFARGRTLQAINESGLVLVHPDGRRERAPGVRAQEKLEDRGGFDVVILALKAHQVPAIAPQLEALCRDDTIVIPMQNGIPFWYFHEHGGEFKGRTIESVDPGGVCGRSIPARRVLGVVAYVASARQAPNEVMHVGGEGFRLGELDGSSSERAQRVAAALIAAGFKCPVMDDIRSEVWLKLWGNAAFNPISALTHATLADICADADGKLLAARLMAEVSAVATKFGATFPMTIEKRIEVASRVGRHKTSMLQDVETGQALEVDALVGSVVELGAMVGVATPTIDALYRAVKLLDRAMRAGNLKVRAEPTGTS